MRACRLLLPCMATCGVLALSETKKQHALAVDVDGETTNVTPPNNKPMFDIPFLMPQSVPYDKDEGAAPFSGGGARVSASSSFVETSRRQATASAQGSSTVPSGVICQPRYPQVCTLYEEDSTTGDNLMCLHKYSGSSSLKRTDFNREDCYKMTTVQNCLETYRQDECKIERGGDGRPASGFLPRIVRNPCCALSERGKKESSAQERLKKMRNMEALKEIDRKTKEMESQFNRVQSDDQFKPKMQAIFEPLKSLQGGRGGLFDIEPVENPLKQAEAKSLEGEERSKLVDIAFNGLDAWEARIEEEKKHQDEAFEKAKALGNEWASGKIKAAQEKLDMGAAGRGNAAAVRLQGYLDRATTGMQNGDYDGVGLEIDDFTRYLKRVGNGSPSQ
ncbi:unnamed protein product [Amoebophrya sp. A25]|nr:unnamed protein product [Amoebophrya sp. A25]|eukprot:GSA25T00022771001.1